ncbi:MAG: hypothetical protein GF311_20540 [Candidatus Lokiarchaeota archaeon]|nr:hypothetical protein [Candidatus Lokiarchaeota archaeon]
MNDMNMNNEGLTISCPACGYTFKLADINMKKEKVKCPACGYEIKRKPLRPGKPDKPDFDQPIV